MYKKYVHVSGNGNNVIYHTALETGVKLSDNTDTEELAEGQNFKGDKLCTQGFVQDQFRLLLGKTLTIIDASISEPKQNKAIKDLIKAIYSERLNEVSHFLSDPKGIESVMADIDEENLPHSIDIEEALGVR
jgi:hypothetical protein